MGHYGHIHHLVIAIHQLFCSYGRKTIQTFNAPLKSGLDIQLVEIEPIFGLPLHYRFCPLVKLTYKDLAKLSALAAIFKTKSYFR